MLVLNFSHPLTEEHLTQIRDLTGREVDDVLDLSTQFDVTQPFAPQVVALVDSVGLTPTEWQTLPLLVNPPSLNVIAVTLLAELHGRVGYFPPVLRLRTVTGVVPPLFEAAEIIDLHGVREQARTLR